MAERPVFVPTPDSTELVKEVFFELQWHTGFAAVQKGKKHQGAARGRCICWLCAASGDLYEIRE